MNAAAMPYHTYKRRPSTKATSPFRYPGGKGFLTDLLRQKVMNLDGPERAYAEPFCGGAGAAINLLLDGDVQQIHLNDLDPCVYSAWVALVTETDRFVEKLSSVLVTVDEWKKLRQVVKDHSAGYSFEVGFATFFLNRTSRAGIVKGSGPIGGYEQKGNWKIDARFYRETMIKRIKLISQFRDNIQLSNDTAEEFLDKVDRSDDAENTFVFIDPPYYEVGSRLYLNGMGETGHSKLAKKLQQGLASNWLMTYDDHPEIRRLYSNFDVTELEVLYSLQRQRRVNEVVIQAGVKSVPKGELYAADRNDGSIQCGSHLGLQGVLDSL